MTAAVPAAAHYFTSRPSDGHHRQRPPPIRSPADQFAIQYRYTRCRGAEVTAMAKAGLESKCSLPVIRIIWARPRSASGLPREPEIPGVPGTDAPARQGYRSDFRGCALASTFSLLKTDLQPLLSCAYCLCMQAVIRSTSGTSALHNRMASSEQSRCCSAV